MKYIDTELLRAKIEKWKSLFSKEKEKDASKTDKLSLGGRIAMLEEILVLITSLQQEQPEPSNGKFVFPNFLYARTVDNKTIDVSYVPQSLDAVEYIKNVPTEQPEVDLEEEIWRYETYLEKNGLTASLCAIAHHFFELGLNARKEE